MEHDYREIPETETVYCQRCGRAWIKDFIGFIDDTDAPRAPDCAELEADGE